MQTTEYPLESTLEALRAANGRRQVCLIEGVAGSGKSTYARALAEAWGESALHLSTDAFIKITRHDWAEHLDGREIDLRTWFDLAKVEKAVRQFLAAETIRLENIYNLSNGRHDLTVEHDARPLDLLVIEGLFAFDPNLSRHAALAVFLDLQPETAKALARERDLTERNLSPDAFEMKERIYFDCYMPFLETFREQAALVLRR